MTNDKTGRRTRLTGEVRCGKIFIIQLTKLSGCNNRIAFLSSPPGGVVGGAALARGDVAETGKAYCTTTGVAA